MSTKTRLRWRWLRPLEFDSEVAGETLAEHMGQVNHLEEKRARIAEQIEKIFFISIALSAGSEMFCRIKHRDAGLTKGSFAPSAGRISNGDRN
jgi:hypothetical protein